MIILSIEEQKLKNGYQSFDRATYISATYLFLMQAKPPQI